MGKGLGCPWGPVCGGRGGSRTWKERSQATVLPREGLGGPPEDPGARTLGQSCPCEGLRATSLQPSPAWRKTPF